MDDTIFLECQKVKPDPKSPLRLLWMAPKLNFQILGVLLLCYSVLSRLKGSKRILDFSSSTEIKAP